MGDAGGLGELAPRQPLGRQLVAGPQPDADRSGRPGLLDRGGEQADRLVRAAGPEGELPDRGERVRLDRGRSGGAGRLPCPAGPVPGVVVAVRRHQRDRVGRHRAGPVPGRRLVRRLPHGRLGHLEGLGVPLLVLALQQVVREPLADPAAQFGAPPPVPPRPTPSRGCGGAGAPRGARHRSPRRPARTSGRACRGSCPRSGRPRPPVATAPGPGRSGGALRPGRRGARPRCRPGPRRRTRRGCRGSPCCGGRVRRRRRARPPAGWRAGRAGGSARPASGRRRPPRAAARAGTGTRRARRRPAAGGRPPREPPPRRRRRAARRRPGRGRRRRRRRPPPPPAAPAGPRRTRAPPATAAARPARSAACPPRTTRRSAAPRRSRRFLPPVPPAS